MKIRRATCAAVIIGLVVFGALMYLLYRILGNKSGGASDPSYALVTSPLNNGIVFLNDPTYVQVSAMLTHRDFSVAKLFVDGEEFALDAAMQPNAPRNTVTCTSEDLRFCGSAALRLLWLPAEAGPHRLSACLLGDEQAAAPWKICTDDANVVVTDPGAPLASAGTYQPQPGDSVASVAEKFGLPAVLVAAANPGLDVAKALSPDRPVIIPGDPSSAAFGPGPSSSTGPWTVATAGMKTALPVDKAYCYYSLGADYWTRIPAGPDTFAYPLDGTLDLRPELSGLTIPASAGSLAMECWGWSGASLIPLGSGKTTIVPASSSTLHLDGDQFTLDVTLGSIPGDFETMDKKLVIPPPVDVAETNKADVCIKHGPSEGFESLLWTLFCKAAVEKGVTTLVWDWIRPLFPLDDPKITLATAVDGYHVYMVPAGGKPSLIKTIANPDQKALDLSFLKGMIFLKGFPTFFVRAYIGPLESADSNHFTLRSEASGLATVTLDPSVVHFGGQKKNKTYTGISVCETGLLLISGSPSIGGDEVAVGYEHVWPEDDCLTYNEEYSRAYFAFDLSSITGPVSSASLTYRQGGFTSAAGQSCARRLGMITADPSYDLVELLPTYGTAGTAFKADVTSEVRNWQAGTPNNGFVFVGADETLPPTCGGIGEPGCIGGGTETCWTTYAGHQLTVTYFVP